MAIVEFKITLVQDENKSCNLEHFKTFTKQTVFLTSEESELKLLSPLVIWL
jgi:hypothetical protein